MIYLDNAATTRPKPPGVAEAVVAAMESYGNSGRGVHEEALAASRTVYAVRCQAAELFSKGNSALKFYIWLIDLCPNDLHIFSH